MSFENENDVSSESSPEVNEPQETHETPTSEPNEDKAEADKAAVAKAAEDKIPFHQHPRFQELINEKNQWKTQFETQGRQLQEMAARLDKLPKDSPQKDELMERLKGIDPAFAERFGKLGEVDKLKAELAEFKQWREQSANETLRQNIDTGKTKFYTENKVPAERHDVYNAMFMNMIRNDPRLTINDLPKVMKTIHDTVGKMFTNVERGAVKQLADSKRADAAKPASLPRGSTANRAAGKESPMSKRDLQAAIIKESLDQIRSEKDI